MYIWCKSERFCLSFLALIWHSAVAQDENDVKQTELKTIGPAMQDAAWIDLKYVFPVS